MERAHRKFKERIWNAQIYMQLLGRGEAQKSISEICEGEVGKRGNRKGEREREGQRREEGMSFIT